MDETVSIGKCILNAKPSAYQWTFGTQPFSKLGANVIMKRHSTFRLFISSKRPEIFVQIFYLLVEFLIIMKSTQVPECYRPENDPNLRIYETIKLVHRIWEIYLSQAINAPIFNQRSLLIISRQVISHSILRDFNSILSSKLIYLH